MTTLDEVTRVALAPNPSPMTLEGTNTYLLGKADHGAVVVVDPGPLDVVHLANIERLMDGAEVAAVLITHHHADHAEAAGWAGRWGAPLLAFDSGLVKDANPVADGEILRLAGLSITAVHTPGHASDHLCLRIAETGVVLTGDHVLGRGSSVVNWPDGDMAAYMRSLEVLARQPGRRLFPGHGPMVEDPAGKIAEYIAHRHDRQRQILAAIAAGADSARSIVAAVYTDVPDFLHPAAERSVNAVLEMLVEDGAVDPSLAPDDNLFASDPSRDGSG